MQMHFEVYSFLENMYIDTIYHVWSWPWLVIKIFDGLNWEKYCSSSCPSLVSATDNGPLSANSSIISVQLSLQNNDSKTTLGLKLLVLWQSYYQYIKQLI